jgi:hypothetical protein
MAGELNILTSAELGRGISRIGLDRTLDDRMLWRWVELAQTKESFYEAGSLDDLNDEILKRKYKEVVSQPSFEHDRQSFCIELLTFLETHSIDTISLFRQRQIEYVKIFYNKYYGEPIKEPGVD